VENRYRKTIFLAIAFGTSVRDVLRNSTFKVLTNDKTIRIVIFAINESEEFKMEFGGDNIEFVPLNPFKPTRLEKAVLHFHRATIRDRCKTIDLGNTAGDTYALDKFTPIARLLLFLFGGKMVNKIVYYLYMIFSPSRFYHEEFERYKPDLVLLTRVLNFSADYPLLRAANKYNVPAIALVSSWDNLTSKAFFPFKIKSMVVWNEVIKKEAMELFYFPENNIFISGIPRYDLFFSNPTICSKVEFCMRMGLDPEAKIILYCTGSGATGSTKLDLKSPESEIAGFLLENINNGFFKEKVQLLVRLHPQANPEEYMYLNEMKNVILHIPGRKSSFQDRLFSGNDDLEYLESLKHSSLMINLASTVTIDASVFDLPTICINFDYRGKRPFKYSVKRLYVFDHYAKLGINNGFELADSKQNLLELISENLRNPSKLRAGRQKIVSQQCYYTDGNSGERVASYILKNI